MADPMRPWKSSVPRECPRLASASCKCGDVSKIDQEPQDDVEEQVETLGSGSVEQGDERPIRFDDCVERANAEKHGDEHDEAEKDIAHVRPPNRLRHDNRRVLDLLCQMNDTV